MRRWTSLGFVILGTSWFLGAAILLLSPPSHAPVLLPDGKLDLALETVPPVVVVGVIAVFLASLATYLLHYPTRYSWRRLGRQGWVGLLGTATWFAASFSLAQAITLAAARLGWEPFGILTANLLAFQGSLLLASLSLVFWNWPDHLARWLFGELPATRALPRGFLEYLRAFPVIFCVMVGNGLFLEWLAVEDTTPANVEVLLQADGWIQVSLMVLFVTLLAPLAEEFFFRGVLYRNLRDWWGPMASGVGSALVFSLIHFDPITAIPLFVVGYLLARSYERTGSVLTVASMHATHNVLNLALLKGLM